MKNLETTKIEALINLLGQIKDTPIELDEFYKQLPEELKSEPTLKEIIDNAEDVVEHAPGYWFHNGVNTKMYESSTEYNTLVYDILLLEKLIQKEITLTRLKLERWKSRR